MTEEKIEHLLLGNVY